MKNELKPREGELPDITLQLLDDMKRVAPDVARALIKYMPAPPDDIAFVPKDATRTLKAYCKKMLPFWDMEFQFVFNEQLRQMVRWIHVMIEFQREAQNDSE